jgi:hypothetical protein
MPYHLQFVYVLRQLALRLYADIVEAEYDSPVEYLPEEVCIGVAAHIHT